MRIQSPLRRTCLAALGVALLTASCGPAQPERRVEAKRPGSGDGAPDLAAAFEATQRGPQPGDAIVTFAVFAAGTPPAQVEAKLAAAVSTVFQAPPAELAGPVGRAGPIGSRFTLSSAPVDAELPLNLALLVETAGEHLKADLSSAGQVAFVRFAGPPLPAHGQIDGATVAAVAVARALGAKVIVDLSTLEAASPDALVQALETPPMLESHVRVLPVGNADGTVTLRTRGLAQFGKPDLEMSALPAEAVKASGAKFVAAVQAMFDSATGGPELEAGGWKLGPCVEPPEQYDHLCAAVPR